MKILRYEVIPEVKLLALLKRTRLKGFDQAEVYRNASLKLVQQVETKTLVPPQRYVLTGGVQTILELADAFLKKRMDIFSLRGGLLFWLDGSNPDSDPPIPFLPPIVEESTDRDGKVVSLVNDGMHRVFAARERRKRINIIMIKDVPSEFPYYAYPFLGGWDAVEKFVELPDTFQKKDYRDPANYKALFRQFNEIFPGVQEQRKRSNPEHLKG